MSLISKSLYLKEEEEIDLINDINNMINNGFAIRKSHLIDEIQRLLTVKNRKNNFVNNRPSDESLEILFNKYQFIKSELENTSNLYVKDINSVKKWFNNIESLVKNKDDLTNKSFRIWVLDSIEFKFDINTQSYISEKQMLESNITLCTIFGGHCTMGPTVLIYDKNEKFYPEFTKDFPINWMLKVSEKGQMNIDILKAYINVLVKYLEKLQMKFPILLLVNAQRIPFSLDLGSYCKDRGIILHAMYQHAPNSANELVKGDFMYLIKQMWDSITCPRQDVNPVKKREFLSLIQYVFKTLDMELVKNTFRSNGIYPWRPNFMDEEEARLKKFMHYNSRGGPIGKEALTKPPVPKSVGKRVHKKRKTQHADEAVEQLDSGDYYKQSPSYETLCTSPDVDSTSHHVDSEMTCEDSSTSFKPMMTSEDSTTVDTQIQEDIQPIPFIKMEPYDPELNEVVDVMTLCRVCAGSSGVMLDIFSEAGQTANLQHKILKFLDINVCDNDTELPHQICHICLNSLEVCHHFANAAAEADIKLREMVTATRHSAIEFVELQFGGIKEEPVEPGEEPEPDEFTSKINQLVSDNDTTLLSAKLSCVPKLNILAKSKGDIQTVIPSTSRPKKSNSTCKKYYTKEIDENNLTCRFCHEVFPEIHNICAHYKVKHGLYYCRYCFTHYKTCSELRAHEKIHFVTCKFCGVQTRYGKEFRAHIKEKHSDEIPYYLRNKTESCRVHCKLCDVIAATTVTAKTHYFYNHQKQMCEFCFELLETKSDFTEHISEVHQIPCIHCPEVFYTYLTYKRHLNKEHKDQNVAITEVSNGNQCTVCSKSVNSKINLKRHYFWGHAKYMCLICLSVFPSLELQEKHSKIHGAICIECNKHFKSAKSLTEHYNTQCIVKPYICEHCGLGFDSNSELTSHRPSHEPHKEHLCDQCGKEFKTSTLLGQHKYVHNKHKNKVICPYCGRKFTFQSQLNSHLSTHTDEKSYKCLDCNLEFASLQALRLHMKTHEIMYKCKICPLNFKSKLNLKCHVKAIHETNVIYKCNQCSKKYTNERDMQIHLKCHVNVLSNDYIVTQGFYCDFCKAVFSTKSYMKSHIVKKHLK